VGGRGWRGRFSKTSFATGSAEKALGQPAQDAGCVMTSEISRGWALSFETFYSQGDRTRAIEDRNIARDAAEYDDAG
jgi:hypothetical protein